MNEAAKEGYTDKARLGAWGLSLGGHSVLSTLSQTGIFKTGVAANGVADTFSNYASLGLVRGVMSGDLFAVGHVTLYEGAPEEGLFLGGPPWERPYAYADASPLAHAGSMNTPLLLLTGELDWGLPDDGIRPVLRGAGAPGQGSGLCPLLGRGPWQFQPRQYPRHLAPPARLVRQVPARKRAGTWQDSNSKDSKRGHVL